MRSMTVYLSDHPCTAVHFSKAEGSCMLLMSRSEVGGEPVRTTCEYRWEVLTVLNNPMCGCKQTQITKRKKSQYFAIHHAKHIYFMNLLYRIHFLRLFIKRQGYVPIYNMFAICWEVVNCKNREVLHLGKCFISQEALF